MGRRALPKLPSHISLEGHFLEEAELPSPWDWNALFSTPAPVEVEVGSGKGLFLATAASEHPERNFLGIEIAGRYARHSAAQVAQAKLSNAVMVHGDAAEIFRTLLPEQSVAAVHVYFPDPWWKTRHRKRRIINPRFVADAQRVLRAGGTLHFWTDVQEYFETGVKVIASAPELSGPLPVAEQPAEHDLDYRTHFERRMRQHGEAVFRSLFRKKTEQTS